jgi:hypothetical protein
VNIYIEKIENTIKQASSGFIKKSYLARRRRINRSKNKKNHFPTLVNQIIEENRVSKVKVFLSHSWSLDSLGRENHKRVAQLDKLLRSRGINTWFDEKDLGGNIVTSMCEGIDSSDIVIICVCSKYIEKCLSKDNQNCRLELDYSFERKGVHHLIPVIMDPNCLSTKEWGGPVGAYLGCHIYVDLSDDDFKNLDRLLGQIERIKNRPL